MFLGQADLTPAAIKRGRTVLFRLSEPEVRALARLKTKNLPYRISFSDACTLNHFLLPLPVCVRWVHQTFSGSTSIMQCEVTMSLSSEGISRETVLQKKLKGVAVICSLTQLAQKKA